MQTTIPRGGSKAYHVKVTNAGTANETIALFPTAALGIWSGGPSAQPQSALTSWNHISPATVTLAPGQSGTFTDTISVPASAPTGLQPVAVAWAYVQGPAGSQVTMAAAAGIREYITVS